jgi:hypothetical protein
VVNRTRVHASGRGKHSRCSTGWRTAVPRTVREAWASPDWMSSDIVPKCYRHGSGGLLGWQVPVGELEERAVAVGTRHDLDGGGRDGTRRLYALRPEASEPVRALLDELWPASLSRLKATVD